VYTIAVVAHAWWAAAGAYVLAREWHLSRTSAAVTGVCFGASGPLLSLVSVYHHYMGAAWMPWVLVALEEALAPGSRRAALALGTVVAVQVLAGSGDMVVLTALAAGLRVAVGLLRGARPRVDGGAVGRLALAAALALGLSAAQWMPTVALLRRSSRAAMNAGANLYWSVHPGALVELLLPRALPSLPLSETLRAALFESRDPFLPSLYLGLTPALLAVPLAVSGARAAIGSARPARLAGGGALLFLLPALGR